MAVRLLRIAFLFILATNADPFGWFLDYGDAL